ncbi:PREDICTED: polyadenylate-binding protein, cytoplasmic and nuclear-like isoform 1 [Fragaria vesca subsp. vesca]
MFSPFGDVTEGISNTQNYLLPNYCFFILILEICEQWFYLCVLLSSNSARLVIDPNTQRPKGFGFVTYKSEVEAQKAIKVMDGRMVDGRLLFVEVAHPEDTSSL